MYSIILSVGAYTLLLSSVITIVLLLRKQFKQWINTSLYILTMSDVLFSILTSGTLLMHYIKQSTYADDDKQTNSFSLSNKMWEQEDDNQKDWKLRFTKFNESFTPIINQNNFNVSLECNVMNLITKYGIFFFPFTNSFVSLLIFSVQCNLNVFSFKTQCFKFLESQECIKEKLCENDNSTHNTERCEPAETNYELKSLETRFDSKLNLVKNRNISIIGKNKEKFLQVFKYDEIKRNNKKIVSIFVITQWIIPILVTGLLYLAEYNERNYVKNMEHADCFMENSFLFDDCYNSIKPMHIVENTESEVYTIPINKDYADDENLTNSSTSNNAETNEIISKVQNIVYSLLNNTYNISQSTEDVTFDNVSELTNITKYLQVNTLIRITAYNNSVVNTNSTKDIILKEYESPYDLTDFQNNTNSINNVQLKHDTSEYDEKLLLSNYNVTNSAEDIIQKPNDSNNEIIMNKTEKLDFDTFHTDISAQSETIANENLEKTIQYTTPVISNDQIYADILSRIHNITMHNKLRNHYKNKHQYNKPKYNKLQQVLEHNSTLNEQVVPSIIKINLYQHDNTSKITPIYTIDKCFISIQFLKLHLLALVFIIYFLPILFSSILHQQGKLNCQLTLNRLKAESGMLSNKFSVSFLKDTDNISFNGSVDSEGVSLPHSNPKQTKGSFNEELNSNVCTLQEMKVSDKDYTKKWNVQYKNVEHYSIDDKKKMYLNMSKQMENILKLFNITKMSLLCGTLLWTPIFSEILLKVFTIQNVPKWLLNITYLGAIAFGILRNIFNIKMIKYQEMSTNVLKTNSIYPIK